VQGPIRIRVQVPNEEGKSEWKLNGQTLTINVNLTDNITTLKERVKDETGLPVNKQKLKVATANNLAITKDQQNFAFYNIIDQAVITVEVKRSGGKKRAKK
jgi:splicing factor 3A subunit 1